MTEEELRKFKEYLTWYIECAEEGTAEYDAAVLVLKDVEKGLAYVKCILGLDLS